MTYVEIFKEYLKWFTPLIFMGIAFWFIFRPVGGLALFLACVVPIDRSRVSMIKRGYSLPSLGLAWKIIGTSCVYPLFMSVLIGFHMDENDGRSVAQNIIATILVFVAPLFAISGICFLSSATWVRAQKKYGVA